MSKDASAIYQELRDLASKALGEHWAEAKALIEPELHRIAEFMTRVGEWLRAGEISEDEARAMLELRLDELAAILRALDMPGKSFLRSDELGKRLRDALRAYIFPAEAMMERPGPPSFLDEQIQLLLVAAGAIPQLLETVEHPIPRRLELTVPEVGVFLGIELLAQGRGLELQLLDAVDGAAPAHP